MPIRREVLKCRIIGKEEGIKGLFFKEPKYKVAIQIIDERAKTNPSTEREVSFHQYSSLNKGDVVHIGAYTANGKNWCFSREEAEVLYE